MSEEKTVEIPKFMLEIGAVEHEASRAILEAQDFRFWKLITALFAYSQTVHKDFTEDMHHYRWAFAIIKQNIRKGFISKNMEFINGFNMPNFEIVVK